MNLRLYVRGGLAVAALALGTGLAACGGGGGGSAALPCAGSGCAAGTSAPLPVASSGPFAATTVPLQVTPIVLGQNVDPSDTSPVALVAAPAAAEQARRAKVGAAHLTPLYDGVTPVPGLTIGADRRGVLSRRPSTAYVGYPGDLYYGIYAGSGYVLGSSVSHPIYVNCASTCWGKPGVALVDMLASSELGVVNQYIGSTQANRYTKGVALSASMTYYTGTVGPGANPVVGESDLLALLYSAASQYGAGYGNIYHIFLPPNVDTCFDKIGVCYSPDYLDSFAFCAYHSSADFAGLGHVLYTVQPYVDVPGCRVRNGVNAVSGGDDPIDSTANVLLHELAETITDPDPDSAWVNPNWGEIGDVCQPFRASTQLNQTNYTVQFLYSNLDHACSNTNLHPSSAARSLH